MSWLGSPQVSVENRESEQRILSMGVHPRIRQVYQEHLRAFPRSTRQERWDNMLYMSDIKNSADHRGLQFAFDQLEREYESTSRAV